MANAPITLVDFHANAHVAIQESDVTLRLVSLLYSLSIFTIYFIFNDQEQKSNSNKTQPNFFQLKIHARPDTKVLVF